MSRDAVTRRVPPRRTRRGTTLVEVLVALVMIVVGVLAVAGVAPVFARLQRKGNGFTQGAVAAQSRFDSLAAVPCKSIPLNVTTVATARGVQERWVATLGFQIINVTDSVRVPGIKRPVGYLSIIPCRR